MAGSLMQGAYGARLTDPTARGPSLPDAALGMRRSAAGERGRAVAWTAWTATFAALARAGFRRYATYRTATLAGAFTNSVFGYVRAAILTSAITGTTIGAAAATGSAASVAGYTGQAAVTYAWLSQGLVASVSLFAWTELAQRVRTGDIAVDLARPVDLQAAWLAADLGRAGYQLLPRGGPPVLVGALTTGLFLPDRPWPYLLGAVSAVLAVVVSFACRFAVNLTAFWLTEIRGLAGFYAGLTALFCGLLVPVPWFPDWLRTLAWATPFPSMLQVPVDILSARVDATTALRLLAVQLGWVALTLAVGRLMLRLATRRLVVQGG